MKKIITTFTTETNMAGVKTTNFYDNGEYRCSCDSYRFQNNDCYHVRWIKKGGNENLCNILSVEFSPMFYR